MAKDRRNKVRPQLDLENGSTSSRSSSSSRETRRTQTTAPTKAKTTSSPKKKRKKKNKLSRAALILRCVMAVLVITMLIFLGLVAKLVYDNIMNDNMPKQDPIDPLLHDVTPADSGEKVAYYLVGLLGENESADTEMMAMVCHDKVAGAINILQLPNDTAIEESDIWAVDTVDAIFANPKPLDWCEICRARVYAPEINEGDVATHTVCGTEITSRKGSATESLADFVNDQLALPVDDYFLLRPATLSELIGYVGGIDVELSSAYTLDGTAYEAGVHTLSGDAALEYLMASDVTETTRMIRQREVFGALLTRIFRLGTEMGYEAVEDDVIEEVMSGEYPIRTQSDAADITALLKTFSGIGVNGMTAHILPGEIAVDGDGDTVYSAHKQELLTLLNQYFTPHTAKLSQADLLIPELANTVAGDTKAGTLGSVVVEQTGKLLDQTAQADQ